MSNNKVPKEFKVLSEFPILVIRYYEKLSLYPIRTFFIVIVMILIISTFIVACWLSIEPLSTLPNRISQPDFWQLNPGRIYFDEKRFSLPGIMAIILFLVCLCKIMYDLVWDIFGISEFRASPENLIVKHHLFGIGLTHIIPSNSLLHFQEYQISSENKVLGWTLKAITNQRRFLIFNSKIMLLNIKDIKHSDWLGTVLADFYQVKFLPHPKRYRL